MEERGSPPGTAQIASYAVARGETLLDNRGERRDLCGPSDRVMLLEAVEDRLEHAVQLRRWLIPAHDRVAEPQQTLQERI